MKRLFTIKSFILALGVIGFGATHAQCIETNMAQNLGNSISGHSNTGQAFTASCSGNILTVSFEWNTAPSAADKTLNIRDGGLPGSPIIHTQTVPGASLTIGVNTITIDTDVPITMGEQNAVEILDPNGISWNSPGAYAGGDAWFSGSVLAGFDLTFEVVIGSSLDLGEDDTLCPGDSLLLDAGSGYDSYAWSTGDTTQTLAVGDSGTYWVMVVEPDMDTLYDTINVAVYTVTPVDLGPDKDLCAGDTVCLDAGSGGVAYLWNNMETTPIICTDSAATYIVTCTDSNGCESTDELIVSDLAFPDAIIAADSADCENVYFTDGSTDATAWDWMFGDSNTSTDQNPMHSYGSPGSYTVTLVASNACGSDSTTITVDITCFTSIEEETNGAISVYPNPTTGSFFVDLSNLDASEARIEMYSLSGEVIIDNTIEVKGQTEKVSMDGVANGTYVLKLTANGESAFERIVISK